MKIFKPTWFAVVFGVIFLTMISGLFGFLIFGTFVTNSDVHDQIFVFLISSFIALPLIAVILLLLSEKIYVGNNSITRTTIFGTKVLAIPSVKYIRKVSWGRGNTAIRIYMLDQSTIRIGYSLSEYSVQAFKDEILEQIKLLGSDKLSTASVDVDTIEHESFWHTKLNEFKANRIISLLVVIGASIVFMVLIKTAYTEYETKNWPHTIGIVTQSNIGTNCRAKKAPYYAIFQYQYVLGSQTYFGKQVTFKEGTDYPCFEFQESVEKLIGKYPLGTHIDVYYDPISPNSAVIVTGQISSETKANIVCDLMLFCLFFGFYLRTTYLYNREKLASSTMVR